MCNDNIFIVIPAYNEQKRIKAVLQTLQQRYHDIVVVDDGSTDATAQIASACGCHILRHAINRGQGAALQTGITYSLLRNADIIVTFDADGQHRPEDIQNLLEPVLNGNIDVALGSRFLSLESNIPPIRKILLLAARYFTQIVTGIRLTDCHNGLRALSRKAAKRINLHQDRMAHASEFYDQLKTAELSYKEVPVSIFYTADTLAKGQRGLDSISILFQYIFQRLRAKR
jgi:glycosyltransferase involved in cell wall biosynthesis